MDLTVKYNNKDVTPTPLVSRSMQFIDFGGRWGQAEQIDLTCSITGIITPSEAIQRITDLFSGQFKTLEVYEGATKVYSWPNIVLQNISINKSSFPVGGFIPYSTKLISYQVPSGVTDPSNEYSFSQSEDGTATVNHKISARGIKDTRGALDNAISFVKTFVGQNPYSSCVPSFIPNGTGILLSVSESIDRASCTYSVNEVYKFQTGSTVPYIETNTLSINNSLTEEYVSLDLGVKWQGSPVNNNLSQLQTALTTYDPTQTLKSYGIVSNNIFLNTYNIIQDSGQVSLELKINYLSGLANDFSGYFDYSVSSDEDLINQVITWKVEGDFICKGPVSFRRSRITTFKGINQSGGFAPYLYGLITSSALYSKFPGFTLNPLPTQLSISENTGLAVLRLSASFSDADTYSTFLQPKYSVEVEPSRWIYELMPAANIEGHYIIQDLQMRNQSKIKLAFNTQTSGTVAKDITNAQALLDTISGSYVSGGFIQSENLTTGIGELVYERDILGQDSKGTGFLISKVYGSVSNPYLRQKGFKFGF